MNSLMSILQTVLMASAQSGQQQTNSLLPFDTLWQHVNTLDLIEALTFIAFGVVWLFYGWRIFKILVTICFGLLGLVLGIWANQQLIDGDSFWLGAICAAFFAILSIPFMRWGVSILGAFSGAVLTAGAWMALGLPQEYVWAGGLTGLIAGGMISFIIFKIAVILFTSLGGSVLLAVGAMAILCHHLITQQELKDFVQKNPWFLPAIVLGPMLGGIFLQNKLIKGAPDWSA
ncbi:MAG: hypothetical protein JW955_01605 [Sedimentisphaerales bacterium]|nr:hypothetical protein [Sedimentisphaerales bacterium]